MHIVSLITSALVLLLASSTSSLLLVPRRDGGLAPLLRPGGSKANLGLPDKYIVKLGDRNPVSASEDLVSSLGIKTDTVYNMTGFKGFSGTLKADILDTLRRRPEVSERAFVVVVEWYSITLILIRYVSRSNMWSRMLK